MKEKAYEMRYAANPKLDGGRYLCALLKSFHFIGCELERDRGVATSRGKKSNGKYIILKGILEIS